MKLKAKDRMALVNKKNMERLTGYFDNREGCTDIDLSWAVNHLVDIALGELEAVNSHRACEGCGYAVKYDHGKKIYYCDHEAGGDDMGKLSLGNLAGISPGWCPLREG